MWKIVTLFIYIVVGLRETVVFYNFFFYLKVQNNLNKVLTSLHSKKKKYDNASQIGRMTWLSSSQSFFVRAIKLILI